MDTKQDTVKTIRKVAFEGVMFDNVFDFPWSGTFSISKDSLMITKQRWEGNTKYHNTDRAENLWCGVVGVLTFGGHKNFRKLPRHHRHHRLSWWSSSSHISHLITTIHDDDDCSLNRSEWLKSCDLVKIDWCVALMARNLTNSYYLCRKHFLLPVALEFWSQF